MHPVPGVLVLCGEGESLGQADLCSVWTSRTAVEALGVPCFLGGMARGLLGRNHPLHIRQNRGAALKKADVVILAGGSQPPFSFPLDTPLVPPHPRDPVPHHCATPS